MLKVVLVLLALGCGIDAVRYKLRRGGRPNYVFQLLRWLLKLPFAVARAARPGGGRKGRRSGRLGVLLLPLLVGALFVPALSYAARHPGPPEGAGVSLPAAEQVAGGTVYSYDQLANALADEGITAWSANVGAAVAEAESGGRADAVHLCPPDCVPHQAPERSYGPWQVNVLVHKWVSAACAMALKCAAKVVQVLSSGGSDWSAWSTYNSGAYLAYLH